MQVMLNLDTPEHHPTSGMPKAIRELWYSRRGEGLLGLVNAHGCPNSGCQHKFHFTAPRADTVAWLDLFLEQYPNCEPEVMVLKKAIRNAFVQGKGLNSNGNLHLVLNRIPRQVPIKGVLIQRPWFWIEQDGEEPTEFQW